MKPSEKRFSNCVFSWILRILETYFSYPSETTTVGVISLHTARSNFGEQHMGTRSWDCNVFMSFSHPRHPKPHQEEFVFSCLMHVLSECKSPSGFPIGTCQSLMRSGNCTMTEEKCLCTYFISCRTKKTVWEILLPLIAYSLLLHLEKV